MANTKYKFIPAAQLSKYLSKKQGDKSEVKFARELGIGRISLRNLLRGVYLPSKAAREKLGIDLYYRVPTE